MFLESLSVLNFRNYKEQDIDFDTQIISLTGKNGMGKTNLLDAIHYLSMTKSAINSNDAQNVLHGESFFVIRGRIRRNKNVHQIQCSYETDGGKKFTVEKKPLEKLSAHIGEFPVVMVSPNDTDLVREWSDSRRKFFDGIISQVDQHYLATLIKYNHFLKQRNALLKAASREKKPDTQLLDQYDQELISCGKILHAGRASFIEEFLPIFTKHYQNLTDREEVSITYTSDFGRTAPEAGFQACRTKDLVMQRSTFGVHRDDYDFQLGKTSLKRTGSQGQQKTFVIALRIAQFEIISNHKEFKPLLLLDDIFDKLDDERIEHLTSMIGSGFFGQIFITDARPERTATLVERLDEKVTILKVVNGQLTK